MDLTLETPRGPVHCRYYPAAGASAAVAMVGGVGGDFDSPARQLYPRLAEELCQRGVSALRVEFRQPTILEEAVADLLAGLRFLAEKGIRRVALIGHSFGGAVVIQVAQQTSIVDTVVTLAPQSFGTEGVSELCGSSLLVVHGEADPVLPVACSRSIYARAGGPRRLVTYPGAGHGLDEVAEEVHDLVLEWVEQSLAS